MNCQAHIHPRCTGQGVHKHHRKMRSQGGTNDPENILRVCAFCHMDIHAHPARSYEHGWLVKSYEDPADVEVVS